VRLSIPVPLPSISVFSAVLVVSKESRRIVLPITYYMNVNLVVRFLSHANVCGLFICFLSTEMLFIWRASRCTLKIDDVIKYH
jgi:hypothetical protein